MLILNTTSDIFFVPRETANTINFIPKLRWFLNKIVHPSLGFRIEVLSVRVRTYVYLRRISIFYGKPESKAVLFISF